MSENFCTTKKKALDPFWFVKDIVDRVKREKNLDAKAEFSIIREFSESLEEKRSSELDELKGRIAEIYNIMAGENPSDLRTKILSIAEMGLFGRVIPEEDGCENEEEHGN